MPTAVMPGYLFADVIKVGEGRYDFEMPAGPYESEGGVFSIVVRNPTADSVVVEIRNLQWTGRGSVHFIQPAVWGTNSTFVEIPAGTAFTFVMSSGQVGQAQKVQFDLVVAPAPILPPTVRIDNQIDPWH